METTTSLLAHKDQTIAQQATLLQKISQDNDNLRILVQSLEHQIYQMRKDRYGRKGESLENGQGTLFNEEVDSLNKPKEEPETQTIKRRKPKRRKFPKDLHQESIVYDLKNKTCPDCGESLNEFGEDILSEVDYRPALLYLLKHVKKKYTCRSCQTVNTAPMPSRPIEKSFAGAGLLAHILISKYEDHLPLHRQSGIFRRQGMDISRSTMAGWIKECAHLLEPLVEVMKNDILAQNVVHTDDTVIKVLDRRKENNIKQGRLWSYTALVPVETELRRSVVYDYTPNREKTWPEAFLKDYKGYLQADAYGGYDDLYKSKEPNGPPPIIEVACWAHTRRKFKEVYDSQKCSKSLGVLRQIAQLYKVEKELRVSEADTSTVEQERKFQSKPILNQIKERLDQLALSELPKSPLGKAVTYALNQWTALNVYVEKGFLSIDNNVVERSMRPIALGRKNYLFAGSDEGGKRAAIIYSFLYTCKLNKVEPFSWLTHVLKKLPDYPQTQIRNLLPYHFKKTLLDLQLSA